VRHTEGRSPDLTPAELLASIPDAMLMVDDDWRITHVNPPAEELLGAPAGQLAGKLLWKAFPDAIGTVFHSEAQLVAAERRPRRFTALYEPLGVWLAVRVTPAGDGLALFLTDVTDYKRAQLRAAAYADVQAVLRRVATAVAAEAPPDAVHRIICREAARLVAAHSAWLVRFEDGDAFRVLGAHAPGDFMPLTGEEHEVLPGSELDQLRGSGLPVAVANGAEGRFAGAGLPAAVLAPIRLAGVTWGALAVAWSTPREDVDEVSAWLVDLAELAGLAVGNAEARAELARRATTDPLTGVANLRALQDALDAAISRGRRHDHPLTLALVDVDRFKAVNDGAGHAVADRVLTAVAEELADAVRAEDLVARAGGDEFAVVVDGAHVAEAHAAVERVRQTIGTALIRRGLPEVTLSAGLCEWEAGMSPEGLRRRAEDALHWAKTAGRDGAWVHDPELMEVIPDPGERRAAVAGTGEVVSASDVQRRLRSARAFWQSTVDALPARIAVLSEEGRVVAVNEAWRRDAQALGGIGSNHVEVPMDREAAEALADVLAGRRDSAEIERPLGGRWWRMRADRFAGAAGPRRVVVHHEDVSERNHYQRDLEAARDYLGAVTSSMGDGLLVVAEDGRIALANAAAGELLGRDHTSLPGRPAEDLLHGRPGGLLGGAGPAAAEDDEFLRADGTRMPVSWTRSPLGGEDGQHVIVFHDATERREREARLRREAEGLRWAARIRRALAQDRFELLAQPICDVRTGAVRSHELLLRLRDETGALVAPGRFLPAAEEHRLMGEIDVWVLRRAVEAAASGRSVHVNLSAQSVGDAAVLNALAEAIRDTAVDPSLIVIEVTETSLMRGASATMFLHRVRELGCGLALDDFGTGYSGLERVTLAPVDELKIDLSFVQGMLDDPAKESVVRAIVSLAGDLGAVTVAEGVEDAATLERLRELEVDLAQGLLLGRPA
jgi:diguanylate cyclase (GGDEF)-like protein/PAS domain S-box-containing protein